MRIPFRRIYRGFPELDRFSDEQCRRFVRAATRSGARRHVDRTILLFLTILSLGLSGGVLALLAWAGERVLSGAGPIGAILGILFFLLVFLAPAAPPACVLIARDLLLRRRLRAVFRASGTCPTCRYSLLGLPVSTSGTVTCPECGTEYQVDPSLSQLSTDASGVSRFTPGVTARPPRRWNERRLQLARRIAWVAGIGAVLALPAGLGAYELRLRAQARLAASERPGVAGISAYLADHQPADADTDGPNAFDLLEIASDERRMVDGTVRPEPPEKDFRGRPLYPDFGLIYGGEWGTPAADTAATDADPDTIAELAQEREASNAKLLFAQRCLAGYATAGVYEKLGAVTRARLAQRRPNSSTSTPLLAFGVDDLSEIRTFARIDAARMAIASDSSDLATFVDALENLLALARMADLQPLLIDGLTAVGVESLAIRGAEDAMSVRAESAWLDAISAAFDRQSVELPADYHVEGERLIILDAVAAVFADPRAVRLGSFSSTIQRLAGSASAGQRLGSYQENRDSINATCAAASRQLNAPAWQRRHGPAAFQPPPLILVEMLIPSFDRAAPAFDQREVQRVGLKTIIALERFRLARGEYPERLQDLVPELLAETPIDPWSGNPLIYIRGPRADSQRYILYATGSDRIDDGGIWNEPDPWIGARENAQASDYPIGVGLRRR